MTKTLEAITRTHEQRQGHGLRNHLGASIIGRKCARHIWYTFRWAVKKRFAARILRLFERGNNEEEVLARLLRKAGIHVVTHDPETGQQFRIEDHDGHFGGSLDAKLFDTPDFPGQWVLGEFKTHKDTSFTDLKKKKVKESKPEHYAQMQIYMKYAKFEAGIYFGVNKNDDDMHVEIVPFVREVADYYTDRALKIIQSPVPPDRISSSPGWYICQMCDHKDVCHNGEPKLKNCRTCVHSRPVQGAKWFCTRYNYILNEQEQRRGCQTYQAIPE